MAGKYSFRDPTTQVLKAWGFVLENAPNDLQQPEADDFSLAPGHWMWNGSQWVPFVEPPRAPSPLAVALDNLLAIPNPTIPQIIALLRVWRQQVS